MLNYLTNGTQPDIAFTMNILMHYTSDPCLLHWRLVQQVITYTKMMINYGITY